LRRQKSSNCQKTQIESNTALTANSS